MAELEKMIEGLLEDEGTMEKLKALLGSADKSEDSALSLPSSLDPSTMRLVTKAMSALGSSADDDGARLLCDLKPYISGARKKRVDEAVMILRLLRVLDTFKDDFGKEI